MATVVRLGFSRTRLRLSFGLALALAGCTAAAEATPPPPPRTKARAVRTGPTQVTAATLRHVADLSAPITPRIAFGPGGAWWHWDGEHGTAFVDGTATPDPIDAAALLAASPRAAVDRPLAIGRTLLTAAGPRPLHEHVVLALRPDHPPWGYFDTGATFSPDGALLVITQRWQPSACCRETEAEREPPREVAHFYDTATGATHEEVGVALPVVIGRERLLLGGRGEALHNRSPMYPLDSGTIAGHLTRALAFGIDESVIASAKLARGPRLALYRARDGVQLHEWAGPPEVGALAFHPTLPLLAAAGSDRIELWRVDLATPTRLAKAPIGGLPTAVVFHPDGHRLVLAGADAAVFELTLEQAPAEDGPSPLALALQRDDPTTPPLQAGTDVVALALDDGQVHAYGRGRGLYSFDRGDGQRLRSWRRNDDEAAAVAFAARAPVLAAARRPAPDEESARTRVDIIDARSYTTLTTTRVPRGELAHMKLSPGGTALAWSMKDDPIVNLQTLAGHVTLRVSAGSNGVEAIAVSDDDQQLAVANRHVTHNIFVGTVGAANAKAITTPRGVSRLAFSRDGLRLFVVDFDGKIHVVELAKGRPTATFDPHAGASGELAETPDGRHLVYAREGVRVLDATTGTEVARFGVTAWVRSIAVAPDGHGIAVGDSTGRVQLLTLP